MVARLLGDQPLSESAIGGSLLWLFPPLGARLFAVLAVALAASGCEAVESDKHSLLGPLRSYQARSDVADLLRQRNLAWTVIEDDGLPEGDPRPPFSIVRWQVESFEEGDLSGEAIFVFFNDRLAEVVVFPKDPATLPTKQAAEQGAPSSLRVRIDRDFRGKRYISFEDDRLREEKEAWLSKHS